MLDIPNPRVPRKVLSTCREKPILYAASLGEEKLREHALAAGMKHEVLIFDPVLPREVRGQTSTVDRYLWDL